MSNLIILLFSFYYMGFDDKGTKVSTDIIKWPGEFFLVRQLDRHGYFEEQVDRQGDSNDNQLGPQ